MAADDMGSMEQSNADSSAGFQTQANAGSQVNQAAQDINQITQTGQGSENQAIGQVYGGVVVYVSGGQAVFNQPQSEAPQSGGSETAREIGPNPYKGLLAFHEKDQDWYFGRSREINALWNQCLALLEQPDGVRLLPIYGPSGSGKSSLARAGLIPELGKRPLPGRDRARVAVMVPGTQPLQALATVLARMATNDMTPVQKIREFAEELAVANKAGEYDGLQRIASALPEIAAFPLVVLVDQFEEVYSLCEDIEARDALVSNLLYAARERSRYVSVLLTMRSDFLGGAQKHPQLDRLFSNQGFYVPSMEEDALREVIALPAKKAGHGLDEATVQLLIEQMEEREGALPLLQFALTRIWEGLAEGSTPAQTLEQIGGVSGALAGEAQRVYDGLSEAEQEIARRLFLGLVQLGEGTRDTRRRAAVESLMARADQPEQFRRVMERFTAPGVRLMTVSAVESEETAEVTHEALFEHWEALNAWLNESRDDLRFERRLDEAAGYWDGQQRSSGLLWRNPDLGLLRSYHQRLGEQMTVLQLAFFEASVEQEAQQQMRETRQKQILGVGVGLLAILSGSIALFGLRANQAEQRAQILQLAAKAEQLSNHSGVKQREIGAWLALNTFTKSIRLNGKDTVEINSALRQSLNKLPLATILHNSWIDSVTFSPSGALIAAIVGEETVHIWSSETSQLIYTLYHDSKINSLAFSPDETLLITSNYDDTARVWDIKNGYQPIFELEHASEVKSAIFSPNGAYIATASSDQTARIWEAKTGKIINIIKHNSAVGSIFFSPNGTLVSTATSNDKTHVWKADTGDAIASKKHDFAVNLAEFSADGNQIIATGFSQVQVWNWDNRQIIANMDSGYVEETAFSRDKSKVAILHKNGQVQVWDWAFDEDLSHEGGFIPLSRGISSIAISSDGKRIVESSFNSARIKDVEKDVLVASFDTETNEFIQSLFFSPNEEHIAAVDSQNIRIWDVEADGSDNVLEHNGLVVQALISPDGTHVATASGREAFLWNAQTGKLAFTLKHENAISSIGFSPDGTRIATSTAWGKVQIWNVENGQSISVVNESDGLSAYSSIFSPDGNSLITTFVDHTSKVWDLRTGGVIAELASEKIVDDESINEWNARYGSVAFSPDGAQLVVDSGENLARLWDVKRGKTIAVLQHNGPVYSVAFSSNSMYVATASEDWTAKIWDASTGKLLTVLNHDNWVIDLDFSPDGGSIATASFDHTARVWNVQTGESIATMSHDSSVNSVSFSHDGAQLITASDDRTARVWNARTGQAIATIEHDNAVNSAAFSPDGDRVLTSSNDNTAKISILRSAELAQQICQQLSRNLTASEWKSYMQTNLKRYTLACDLPVHRSLLDEARQIAEAGEVRKAALLYSHLLKISKDIGLSLDLDPATKALETKPRAVALKFSAIKFVRDGERAARGGMTKQAVQLYKKALKLNPEIDLIPDTEEVEQDPEAVATSIAEAAGDRQSN